MVDGQDYTMIRRLLIHRPQDNCLSSVLDLTLYISIIDGFLSSLTFIAQKILLKKPSAQDLEGHVDQIIVHCM